MATVHRNGDLGLLDGKVTVVGYGSQGHAHALNLNDSGVEVVVGLRAGSPSWAAAENAGVAVAPVAEAVKGAQIVSLLLPDQVQPAVCEEHIAAQPGRGRRGPLRARVQRPLRPDRPPAGHDVIMVAPKGPGHIVRRLYTEGYGAPALCRRRAGRERPRLPRSALAYAPAIGATRAGVIETTFVEETETDLFGEQAVLCGGVTELIRPASRRSSRRATSRRSPTTSACTS